MTYGTVVEKNQNRDPRRQTWFREEPPRKASPKNKNVVVDREGEGGNGSRKGMLGRKGRYR
jgi:hypothetical protein